ncbi:MAG: hypothetical protein Q9171_006847 [Xanthocarpia ochracea]
MLLRSVRSKQEFTEPSKQLPAAPGGFPSEAVPYPNLSISPKPDAAEINDGKSTVSQFEHWVEGQQESLNTLISNLKTQVGPNKEQLNAMLGELEKMRRGKARETQGEKIRDHSGNLTAPLPPIRGLSPSSQEPKYNLAGDEKPLEHPQSLHPNQLCFLHLPPIRGHLNQQAKFTAEFKLRESTALGILNIIKFTIGGLIINVNDLEAADAEIYLTKKIMKFKAKEITPTFAGGAESNLIPTKHMISTKVQRVP